MDLNIIDLILALCFALFWAKSLFMPPSRQNIYLPTTLSKQGSDESGKTWKLGINLKRSGKIFVNILFWIIIKKSIDLKYAFCQRFVCLFVRYDHHRLS